MLRTGESNLQRLIFRQRIDLLFSSFTQRRKIIEVYRFGHRIIDQ